MATAMNVSAWSTTAASNDGADATIGTVANGSAPNTVDDWVRGIMAAVKRYVLDTDGGLTSAGTADAQTLTTNRVISSGHQAAGFSLRFKAGAGLTNTGAATMAVDGLTAVSIKRFNGDALSAGDITAGGIYDIAFDGTNYILMGGSAAGGGGGVGGSLTGDNTWSGANTFTGTVSMNGNVTVGNGVGDVVVIKGTTVDADISALFSSATVNALAQSVLNALASTAAAPQVLVTGSAGTFNIQTLANAAINLLSTSNIAINVGATSGTLYLLARDNGGLRWINADHPSVG